MSVKFVKTHKDAKIPQRKSKGAAGYDVTSVENLIIPAGKRALVKTGLTVEIPENLYGRVAPRSGLSLKGIDIGAGVIDPDYRGNMGVIMINNSGGDFDVNVGDAIAQLIFEKIDHPIVEVVEFKELQTTERGENGFGSTSVPVKRKRDESETPVRVEEIGEESHANEAEKNANFAVKCQRDESDIRVEEITEEPHTNGAEKNVDSVMTGEKTACELDVGTKTD
jgi:dUTP pyrophosphatase